MGFRIRMLGHVNVTTPKSEEEATRHFYAAILGLQQIPKPPGPRQFVGAWYELGGVQLHLSVENGGKNQNTSNHVCYLVEDVGVAEKHFREAGVEIIPDDRPMAGQARFYVRDPGGNLIEIAANDE
jgi:catechol 2,3-dioxygenase-like lactoylglutathione lyase family enzyme